VKLLQEVAAYVEEENQRVGKGKKDVPVHING
jgi:hypothetical protein